MKNKGDDEKSFSNDVRIYKIRDPKYWGPFFWNFLYVTILSFPITFSPLQSRELSKLLQNFHIFLPCKKCRYHYELMVKSMDIKVNNRGEALHLLNFLHNKVRKRLNQRSITIEQVIDINHEQLLAKKSWIHRLISFIMSKLLLHISH